MSDRELLQQSLDAHLYHREQTRAIDRTDAVIEALRTRLAQPALAVPLQGGLDNNELLAAWQKKLPSKTPEGQELHAFAVGIEVGFEHAQRLERMDWDRVHHVLKKHGAHPGRTDDHLADVIDKALSAAPAVLEDAKRYQWLRDKFTRLIIHAWPNYDHGQCPCVVREINVSKNFRATDPESTDAAIDAARKAAP